MNDLDRFATLAQILATLFVALAVEERVVGVLRSWPRPVVAIIVLVPYLALVADVAVLTGGDADLFGMPSRVLYITNLIACTIVIGVLGSALVRRTLRTH